MAMNSRRSSELNVFPLHSDEAARADVAGGSRSRIPDNRGVLLEHLLGEFHARGGLAGGYVGLQEEAFRVAVAQEHHRMAGGRKKFEQGTDSAIEHRLVIRLGGHLQGKIVEKRFPRGGLQIL